MIWIRTRLYFGLTFIAVVIACTYTLIAIDVQGTQAQIPTGEIPTVTGTPLGVIATVNVLSGDGVKVRGGPSALFYPEVGFMIVGQTAPALGISPGGNWILIEYPGAPGNKGWVFGTYVNLSQEGALPTVIAPVSPTPEITATLNPTLEAQFIVTETQTRLPTFTPAPPVQIPTYTEYRDNLLSRIPMGFVILILLIFGTVLGLFSLVRRK